MFNYFIVRGNCAVHGNSCTYSIHHGNCEEYNTTITHLEAHTCVFEAKNNKAVGLNNLPYKIFKKTNSVVILCELFNLIFESGYVPSILLKAIIKPLPKNSTLDPRISLQYRGINLFSTVSQLYSSVLNKRLAKYAELNNLFIEEQNGFRNKYEKGKVKVYPHM